MPRPGCQAPSRLGGALPAPLGSSEKTVEGCGNGEQCWKGGTPASGGGWGCFGYLWPLRPGIGGGGHYAQPPRQSHEQGGLCCRLEQVQTKEELKPSIEVSTGPTPIAQAQPAAGA